MAVKWPTQRHEILNALGHELPIELPDKELVVLHGHRLTPVAMRHHRLQKCYPGVRAVVYGHSHCLVEDCSASP